MHQPALPEDLGEPLQRALALLLLLLAQPVVVDDGRLLPPPLLVGSPAGEDAAQPQEEEEGARAGAADAEVDERHVEDLEGGGAAHEVHDGRVGEHVVGRLGPRPGIPVEQHDVHQVVDAEGAPGAGVEAEDEEEAHVEPPDALAEEVAVVVEDEDAAAAVPAVVGAPRNVHVAGLALAPLRAVPLQRGRVHRARVPGAGERRVPVLVAGEVLRGGDDGAAVAHEHGPVGGQLQDYEAGGQLPAGLARVEVDGVVGEEGGEGDVEDGRERLQEEGGDGADALAGAAAAEHAAGGGEPQAHGGGGGGGGDEGWV